MSFFSTLETIGKDIQAGLTAATPVIGGFVPAAGPILTEIGTIIADLEKAGAKPTQAQVSAMVQATTTSQVVKQAVASGPAA